MTPEGEVKKLVKKAMAEHYAFMPVQWGLGKKSLDFLYCYFGRFVAVETKAPGKKRTGLQAKTSREIAASGGLVFTIRDQTDIDEMLAYLTKWSCRHVRAAGAIFDKLPHETDEV